MCVSGMLTVNGSAVSVDEGKRVTLNCEASQTYTLREPITFGWFKIQRGSSPVSVKINRRVVNTSSPIGGRTRFRGNLTFGNASRNDTGDYKCKAYNRYGSSVLSAASTIGVNCECVKCLADLSGLLHYTVALNFFLDGPESVAIHPAKLVGVKGRSFTFSCSAVGYPMPLYWWIPPNGRPYKGKTLTLHNIEFADGGMYRCLVKTRINAGFRSATVRVKFQVAMEGKMLLC